MALDKKAILDKYMEEVFDSSKPYTFISYSHNADDVEKVYYLLIELMKQGINFAIDTEYPSMYGNWMEGMNNRIRSEQCKCMTSFYSATYVYSRPSLLEQYLRYSLQVTINAQKRKKTYVEDLKKKLIKKKAMPCIPISLFSSKGIKKKIEDRDDSQIERLLESKSDWEMDPDSSVYKFFETGLKGFFKDNETLIGDKLYLLGDADNLDCIRESFMEILEEEEVNNSNLHTEVKEIIAMLKSFGIDKDEEIKKKANNLLNDEDTVSEKESTPTTTTTTITTPGPVPENQARYHYKGGKYDAMILVEVIDGKEHYVVEAGSKIAPTWREWLGKKKEKEILDAHSVDENGNVMKSVSFDNISSTAKFITGMSTAGNGMLVPKNKVDGSKPDSTGGQIVDSELKDTRKKEPIEILKSQGLRYNYKGGKYNAMILVEEVEGKERYVVEAGSKIAPTWEEWIGKKKRQEILDAHSVDENGNVMKAVSFDSISSTAKFITGMSTAGNGMLVPKNKVDGSKPDSTGGSIVDSEPKDTRNKAPIEFEYIINHTDAQYNIITLGAKANMGQGVEVVVECNGTKYVKKTHSSAPGRIDGFREIYVNNGIIEGDKLFVKCDFENKIITLSSKRSVAGLGDLLKD